jgi:D-glycero-D-manno-heptose 1,7-bisphosphate phosphatase
VSGARAAFVDRDGVINELVLDTVTGQPESPLRAADVALMPDAARALARLAGAGFLLVGVSNQPAAAKGTASRAEIDAVQQRVLELLREQDVHFDGFELCLHHPHGIVPELSGACECRKPAPGMLLDAARELSIDLASSWMIGDTDADVVAGQTAGCQTVLVQNPLSVHKRGGEARPDAVAPNLAGATDVVLLPERVD